METWVEKFLKVLIKEVELQKLLPDEKGLDRIEALARTALREYAIEKGGETK